MRKVFFFTPEGKRTDAMSEPESLFEEDESAEGGEDYKIDPSDFSEIFVIPSDWTVSTLRQELGSGPIDFRVAA